MEGLKARSRHPAAPQLSLSSCVPLSCAAVAVQIMFATRLLFPGQLAFHAISGQLSSATRPTTATPLTSTAQAPNHARSSPLRRVGSALSRPVCDLRGRESHQEVRGLAAAAADSAQVKGQAGAGERERSGTVTRGE